MILAHVMDMTKAGSVRFYPSAIMAGLQKGNAVKVIFLDVDGVLNSHRSVFAFGGYGNDFTPKSMKRFDHCALGLIRRACKETGAVICFSSTWRLGRTPKECADGLDLPIIDKTPDTPGIRGKQIKEWLDAHPEVEAYAIVDDDSDMLDEQKPFFVHTDHRNGLLFDDYKKLIALLGAEELKSELIIL
jgi:hypothetical protein